MKGYTQLQTEDALLQAQLREEEKTRWAFARRGLKMLQPPNSQAPSRSWPYGAPRGYEQCFSFFGAANVAKGGALVRASAAPARPQRDDDATKQ